MSHNPALIRHLTACTTSLVAAVMIVSCAPQPQSNALSVANIEISAQQLGDAFKELESAALDEVHGQKLLATSTSIDFNDLLRQVGDQPIKLGSYTFVNPRANLLRYQKEILAATKTPSTLRDDLSQAGYHSLGQLNQNELRRNLALTEKIFNGSIQGGASLDDGAPGFELVGKACGAGIGLSVAKGIATALVCVFFPPGCAPAIATTAVGAAFTAVECESDKQHAKSAAKNADTAKKDKAGEAGQSPKAKPSDSDKPTDETAANAKPESSGG